MCCRQASDKSAFWSSFRERKCFSSFWSALIFLKRILFCSLIAERTCCWRALIADFRSSSSGSVELERRSIVNEFFCSFVELIDEAILTEFFSSTWQIGQKSIDVESTNISWRQSLWKTCRQAKTNNFRRDFVSSFNLWTNFEQKTHWALRTGTLLFIKRQTFSMSSFKSRSSKRRVVWKSPSSNEQFSNIDWTNWRISNLFLLVTSDVRRADFVMSTASVLIIRSRIAGKVT